MILIKDSPLPVALLLTHRLAAPMTTEPVQVRMIMEQDQVLMTMEQEIPLRLFKMPSKDEQLSYLQTRDSFFDALHFSSYSSSNNNQTD